MPPSRESTPSSPPNKAAPTHSRGPTAIRSKQHGRTPTRHGSPTKSKATMISSPKPPPSSAHPSAPTSPPHPLTNKATCATGPHSSQTGMSPIRPSTLSPSLSHQYGPTTRSASKSAPTPPEPARSRLNLRLRAARPKRHQKLLKYWPQQQAQASHARARSKFSQILKMITLLREEKTKRKDNS